jgi:nucleoside 2-deoxyribosyltransferase
LNPKHSFPRIYLAGPDVFLPHSAALFARLKSQCTMFGLVGVAPTDGDLPEGTRPGGDELAQQIYEGNVALLESADGVAANLASFRGQEPDSGTVFEVGYAVALGKPVVAYGVPAGSYAERVAAAIACQPDADGVLREADGSRAMVEGLGQRLNLMLARSVAIEASAEAALQRLAGLLAAGAANRPLSR